ncbi:MAG: hypothetical protein L0Y75_09880 [Acidobacteria bacterium]|nr:hypothetical protein [Acidobacteriota bacterium]
MNTLKTIKTAAAIAAIVSASAFAGQDNAPVAETPEPAITAPGNSTEKTSAYFAAVDSAPVPAPPKTGMFYVNPAFGPAIYSYPSSTDGR